MREEALADGARSTRRGGRLGDMLRWFRGLPRRLHDRPDTEHVMTANRTAFCILLSFQYIWMTPGDVWKGVAVMAAGLGIAAAMFIHLLLGPTRSVPRQMTAMFADTIFICGIMHIGGDDLAFWYPALLWMILGNGFRLGRANLLRAMVIGTTGFGVMLATTPFWHDHAALSLGLLVGNVVIPLYVYTLLGRLYAARREAQAADRAKSRFLASVSHELRTPLHAIVGTASLLDKERLSPRHAEMMQTIGAAGTTLIEMVDDILAISRSGLNHSAPVISEVDVASLLASLRSLVQPQAAAKGLTVSLHVGHGTPRRVRGAERQIREILLNLAGNAVKFTGQGGLLVAVREAGRDGGRVRLRFEVVDTGIGIDASAHARIFTEFEQADSSIAGRFGGTGLGLAICKRLAGSIGGEVGVESRIGVGATFWLEVDCEEATPQAAGDASFQRLELLILGGKTPSHLRAAVLALDPEARETRCSPSALLGHISHAGDAERVLLVRLGNHPEAVALTSAARMAEPSSALVAVGSSDAFGGDADLRWVAQSWVPDDVGEAGLAAAIQVARTLRSNPVAQGPVAGKGGDRFDAPPAPPKQINERQAARGNTILVVDDSATNRKVVAMMLQSVGHNCRFASNGEDALAAMEDDDIDLVFMDVNMPGLDGHETVKLYRATAFGVRHMPIVALTADASQETAQLCYEAGMDECITKPVRVAELLGIVEKLIPTHPELPGSGRGEENTDQIQVFDPTLFDSLRAMAGEALLAELALDFCKDADCLLSELEQALESRDLSAFRMHCHALGSASGNLGGMRVRHLSFAMERMRPAEIRSQGTAHFRQLRQEVEKLTSALSKASQSGEAA